jgi:hypothetical protein
MHITVSNPQLTRPVALGGTTRSMTPLVGIGLHLRRRAHRGRQGRAHTPSNQEAGLGLRAGRRSCSVPRADPGHGPQQHVHLGRLWYGCSDECGANPGGYHHQRHRAGRRPRIACRRTALCVLDLQDGRTATPPKSPRYPTTSACPRSRPPGISPTRWGASVRDHAPRQHQHPPVRPVPRAGVESDEGHHR